MMPEKKDEGAALIMVIAAMLILSAIAGLAVSNSIQSSQVARRSTDWNNALAAAEAGVDDYLARLNANDSYWMGGVDCDNLAMRKPNETKCGWGPSTGAGWAKVPGTERSSFHYEVDTSNTLNNGSVRLVSTGKVGTARRTVSTILRRAGFGEFLYYTVYETIDPANEPIYGVNNTTAQNRCAHYFWEPWSASSRPRDTSYCADINFITGDRIDGPLHTNDAMLVTGTPQFRGTVTTSYPACMPENGRVKPATDCYRRSGTPNPTFVRGIAYRAEVELPTSLGDLRQYVDPAQTSSPGCLYTGPTRIRFNDNPSGQVSTMTVWSPWSNRKPLNPGCGNYQGSWPQTMAIPNHNIIMVQDVPSTQSQPASGACVTGSIGDGFPQANDVNQTYRDADCRYGTVYLSGTLKGRLTVAADNNILLVDHLKYSGGRTGTDAMGLIAQNSVQIYHPTRATCTRYYNGRCTSYSYSNLATPSGSTNSNPVVDASILTLQHSFTVQEYNRGAPLGSIKLFGSFAQRFRGPVGTSSSGTIATGYLKDYVYDTRLRYAPPPYFLDPVRASWGVKAYGEVTAYSG
jgi:Tfp pilus assembly protein PilX